jgi:ribosomal protein S18 acetylase RimI-like enzyme
MRSLLRRRPGAALVVVAVRDEARVVGWAAAELKGCRYLLAVFVHPRHRRRGVGDALMRAAWTFAAARWPKAGPLARPADAAGEALYRGAGFESEVELARRAG